MRYEIPVPVPMKMSANDRPNRWERARQTRALRELAGWRARSLRIPAQAERITVGLVWTVKDRIDRDPSNLMPTQKALVDGLVDAGVVPKDTSAYVLETMPVIVHDPTVKPSLTFWIQTFDPYGEDTA